MPLDNTAADAVLDRFADELEIFADKSFDSSARTNMKNGPYGILVREIFRAMRDDAEVVPNGTPPMTADGDPVIGKGRIA